jgi:hypothetical protein
MSRDRQEGRRVAIRRPCQSGVGGSSIQRGLAGSKRSQSRGPPNGVDRLRVIVDPCKCRPQTRRSAHFSSTRLASWRAWFHCWVSAGVLVLYGSKSVHTPAGMPTLSAGAMVPMHCIEPCVNRALLGRKVAAVEVSSVPLHTSIPPRGETMQQIFERAQERPRRTRQGRGCHGIRRCSHQLYAGQYSPNRLPNPSSFR